MALIVAVVGSVMGLLAGIVSTVLFGASVLVGFVIYVAVSLGMITAWAVTMITRGGVQQRAGSTAEDMMDDAWQDMADHDDGAPSTAEDSFREQLETPLSKGERKNGVDRDTA